jgi:RHS repeat-associated protein
VRDAASLLPNSPQDGVVKRSYVTATGRLLQRSTWKGSDRLEYATFTQDPLGHLTSMTRYQDPASGANPVTSGWHLDSLGQLLELDEPDSVPQFRTYSRWGELLETNRTVAGALKKAVQTYDALGRLIHSEQQNGGVIDPETVHDYTYDQGVNVAPQVTPTNVLGRLAKATWPTGSVTFSYDDLGRTNAQVFTDAQGGLYVEKHTLHADGSPLSLELFLPDTGYADEHVDYTYDSAGRGLSVKYTNGDSQDLFQASIIDPLGRVRKAQYGLATYTADYADVGRRLMKKVAVSSPAGSRSISYAGFDPLSRERSRTEIKNDTGSSATTTSTTWTYDAIGRLSSAVQTGIATGFNQQFTYDPLGNLLKVTDTGASATNTTLTYATTDRDRICHIAFGTDTDTACNVTYDELGSILSQPTPDGHRHYTYLVDGSVGTITDDHGSVANVRYDAFGEVQELDLDPGPSSTSTDGRRDRHYGSLITRHQEQIGNSSPLPVFTRKIPLHDGSVATRHGPGGPWAFEYGEQRGNRFFTDQNGAFVQDVNYQPFGKPTSTGAQPGSQLYSNQQWNGGDTLAAFGISQLGARLYDPAIGRFISRDPLLIPRTAATTNPYAFASNDPVNSSDPSGLITPVPGGQCPGSEGCPQPGNGSTRPPDAITGAGSWDTGPTDIIFTVLYPSYGLPQSSPSSPEGPLVPMPSGNSSDATLFGDWGTTSVPPAAEVWAAAQQTAWEAAIQGPSMWWKVAGILVVGGAAALAVPNIDKLPSTWGAWDCGPANGPMCDEEMLQKQLAEPEKERRPQIIFRLMTPQNGAFVDSPLSGAPNSQQKGARTASSVKPGGPFDLPVTSETDPVGPSYTRAAGLSGSIVPVITTRKGAINGIVPSAWLPDGLDAINDHGQHVTIFPARNMTFGEYQRLLNMIPWALGGSP